MMPGTRTHKGDCLAFDLAFESMVASQLTQVYTRP